MKEITVLLVSYSKGDYEFIKGVLSSAQYSRFSVDWVKSIDAAGRALKEKRYDIALVEDDLGVMVGSKFISDLEQDGIITPVILFTSHDAWDWDEAAFQSAAVCCLTKEKINPERLEEIITKELQWKLINLIL
jgi:DNA-binding response OmpR family regulator